MKREFITVVSGLPRSGTSMMMQMLAAGGLPALSDAVRQPDENNPRGYLEFEPVKRLRSDQSWLEQARGHAVKIIHLLLRELPTDGRFHYRILFVRRTLEEVIASQQAMLAREGKASADPLVLTKIFRSQLAQITDWLSKQACFETLEIEHQKLLEDSLGAAEKINAFLGGDLDTAAMAAAVDRTLYRQQARSDAAPPN